MIKSLYKKMKDHYIAGFLQLVKASIILLDSQKMNLSKLSMKVEEVE